MQERNYGLDVFRILSMLMITTLHIVSYNMRLLYSDAPMNIRMLGFILEYACYTGVNCFALLSGFYMNNILSYNTKLSTKAFSLYFKILIWSVLLFMLSLAAFPNLTLANSWKIFVISLQPFNLSWWYITAYFGLLAFIPIINRGLTNFSPKDFIKIIAIMFVAFSLITTLSTEKHYLGLQQGYSTIWLIICYIYGAGIKKLLPEISKTKHLCVIMAVIAGMCIVLPISIHYILFTFSIGKNKAVFLNYTSPFCVLEAAALLILFSRIKISSPKATKIIMFLSFNSLGIYLLQNFRFVWHNVICQKNVQYSSFGATVAEIVIKVLCIAAAGIIFNIIIEKIYKILRLDVLTEKLCKKLN